VNTRVHEESSARGRPKAGLEWKMTNPLVFLIFARARGYGFCENLSLERFVSLAK
jgi:hypothetical protein